MVATTKRSNGGRTEGHEVVEGIESDLADAFLDGHGELGDGVVIVDGGGLVYANEALARMLGIRQSELAKAASFDPFFDPAERSRIATRQRVRLRSAQGIDQGETMLVRKDGTPFPVDYVARRVGSGDRAAVLWILHDTSGDRWTSEELKASEARFQAFSAAVGDAVVYVDPEEGKVVGVNGGAESLFARSRKTLVGSKVSALLDIDGLPGLREAPSPGPYETTARPAGGSSFPVEVTLVRLPFRDAPRVAVVVRDIRLRKESEAKRRQAIEDLRRLNEARTEFINMAAHELRTPLGPMKAEVAMLKTSTPEELGKDQRKSVDAIARNLERLSKFVEDLLEVARMQAGKIEFKKESMDLADLVRKTAGLFETAAQYANVGLEVNATDKCVVHADRSRLEQVVFNLISNAIKFTPATGRVTVTVRQPRKGDPKVEVKDTGIGIAAKERDKLFQPFGQIDKDRQKRQKGAGLGLFICKTLVELQGGSVWVKSGGEGKGATFGFSIPARAD